MRAVHKIFNDARELTDFLNVAGVGRADIVSIIYKEGEFVLFYYTR